MEIQEQKTGLQNLNMSLDLNGIYYLITCGNYYDMKYQTEYMYN